MTCQTDIQNYMNTKGMNRGQFASKIKVDPYVVTQIMNGEMVVTERYRDQIYAVIEKG